MHKILLKEINERKSVDDIIILTDIVDMMLDSIKESSPKFYDHIETLLYEKVYGKKLNLSLAKEIVECMKPYGEHWTFEQTSEVLHNMNLQLDEVDFYAVMNMAYNDYHNLFDEDTNKYIQFSKMFIDDEDADEGKVYNYFMNV